ncbi:arachidonate 5-lipoxygenase-activating protein isoform X2 [Phocoena sinus]|uniref:arachidonate 5-lipoxygenase-activating protein isoform X2 n=1 Tax=Phocoena sinus TaxID=42100 RepID=UPI0013C4DC58|nr:arachidonate 5-lipoxygenase-activating protein isoform X2 [Phocoena sinus]
MDYETLGNVVLLAIVTLISVVQNGFFAHKLEHESKTHNGWSFQRTGTLAFERVYTAKYTRNTSTRGTTPTEHLLNASRRPQTSQKPELCRCVPHLPCHALERRASLQSSTRGYIFGKRIILFLFLMSLAGILNYFLILLFGSDFENYMKTIANTISPLLLIP